MCSGKFGSSQDLSRHSKVTHKTNDRTEVCIKCKISFHSHRAKICPLLQGTLYTCWYCNQNVQEKRHLRIHIKIEHGDIVYGQSEWYMCKICYSTLYSRPQDVIKHMRDAHHRHNIVTSDYLIKSFEDVQIPCSICGVRNVFVANCKSHANDMKGKADMHCSLCHEKYSSENILEAHVNIEHGKVIYDDPNFACYQCHQCNSDLYVGSESFVHHMLDVHNDNVESVEDNLEKYAVRQLKDILSQCNVCSCECLFSMFCPQHDAQISTRFCEQHEHNIHMCTICEAAFVNCQVLWKHKFSLHADNNLQCNFCDDFFTIKSPRALKIHWLQSHWTSEQIEKELNVSSKVLNGVVQYVCPFCDIDVRDFVLLNDHVYEVHLSLLSCSFCRMKFKNDDALEFHLTSTHQKDRALVIDNQQTILNKELLSLSDGDTDQFKCSDCDKTYPKVADLKRHLQTHSVRKSISCSLCSKVHYNVSSLREHYKKSHQMKVMNKTQNLRNQTEISIDGITKYKCPQCPSITSRFDSLQLHMRTHSGEKPFSCDECGKQFSVRERLKRHVSNIHLKRGYQCNVCGRILSDSSNLKVHMRKHTGEKKYVCEVCGKRFTQWASYYYHKFTHSKDRTFKCCYCDMSFRCPRTLKEHKKTHVQSSVKHTCDQCGNEFSSRKNLTSHMRIHVVGRDHQCDICNAKFKLRKYLLQHLKTHNKNQMKASASDLDEK